MVKKTIGGIVVLKLSITAIGVILVQTGLFLIQPQLTLNLVKGKTENQSVVY